jgi:hypothetical protein
MVSDAKFIQSQVYQHIPVSESKKGNLTPNKQRISLPMVDDNKRKKEKLPRYQESCMETESKEEPTKAPSPSKQPQHSPLLTKAPSQEEELLIGGLDTTNEPGAQSEQDRRLQDARRQIEEYLQVKEKHAEANNTINKLSPKPLFEKQSQKVAEIVTQAQPLSVQVYPK